MLTTVERGEKVVGSSEQVIVFGQVVGSLGHTAGKFSQKLRSICIGQCFEFIEQLLSGLGHEFSVPFCVHPVKLRYV